MSFVWKTSSIGYPNFLSEDGAAFHLAEVFRSLANLADAGITYDEAKKTFAHISAHQVETKKAALQQFGLLYVVPRSGALSVTPIGRRILQLAPNPSTAATARKQLLSSLALALARYQFNNPLPAGGKKDWASMSDVRPFLALYYLWLKCDGILTISELFGVIFGIRHMSNLPAAARQIKRARRTHSPFSAVPNLPANPGSRENLKIYFMAQASLNDVLAVAGTADFYGTADQCYELTTEGVEILGTVLATEWPSWDSSRNVPVARNYDSVQDYFENIVGADVTPNYDVRLAAFVKKTRGKDLADALSEEDLEDLERLAQRKFLEGRRRLVTHFKSERNPALVAAAKKLFRLSHQGKLFCEVCDFNFSVTYGDRGKGYIEAHHKVPISTAPAEIGNTADDLGMVCANCHRMLHRLPYVSIDELRTRL